MYLLARYLRCSRLVAAWAAVVFIIFPWHFARAEHASLTHLEVLALLVLALVAAARNPTWLRFGFVGARDARLLAHVRLLRRDGGDHRDRVLGRRGARCTRGRRALRLLAGGAIGACGPGERARRDRLVRVGHERRRRNPPRADSARALRPAPARARRSRAAITRVRPRLLLAAAHARLAELTEISNYLGLRDDRPRDRAGSSWRFGAATAWRRRRPGLVAAFVVGFLFALPSPVAGISMPSKLLWNVLPAFRVPSRWDPLLMTTLLPLAALGLCRRRGAFAGVAVVGVAARHLLRRARRRTASRTSARCRSRPSTRPSSETPNGILAEYPLGYSDIYRLWQRSTAGHS